MLALSFRYVNLYISVSPRHVRSLGRWRDRSFGGSEPAQLVLLGDRRILITGSTGGIGYILARGLGRVGANVIVNGRTTQRLDEVVREFRAEGIAASKALFDVANENEVQSTISELEREGGVDVLINNAGIQRRIPLEDVTMDTWNEVLATNLTGAMLVSRDVVPGMKRRGQGKIVNMCSLMSGFGRATTGPYTAAKGRLKILTQAMCADWARFNIQANAIGPGYFLTKMTQPLSDDSAFDAWVKQRTPASRWGAPEELLGVTIFLSSEASSFVNGQLIYVDGGMSSVL